MQETLGLTDVLDVLIQLETLGHDHYARMERDADNPDLKRLFGILSVQELRHKALYGEWKGVDRKSVVFGNSVDIGGGRMI